MKLVRRKIGQTRLTFDSQNLRTEPSTPSLWIVKVFPWCADWEGTHTEFNYCLLCVYFIAFFKFPKVLYRHTLLILLVGSVHTIQDPMILRNTATSYTWYTWGLVIDLFPAEWKDICSNVVHQRENAYESRKCGFRRKGCEVVHYHER